MRYSERRNLFSPLFFILNYRSDVAIRYPKPPDRRYSDRNNPPRRFDEEVAMQTFLLSLVVRPTVSSGFGIIIFIFVGLGLVGESAKLLIVNDEDDGGEVRSGGEYYGTRKTRETEK